jgi:TP901 family phage tail tape measure protein|nr:MAG TPA: tail tape measure protein [Caudoviricetes sp.]
MARQEVYTTIVKLNSEEAKNRLKELEDKIARLKKAKQDAFSAGDSRLGTSLAKDLKAAEREMKQFKNSTMSVKETLDNLFDASLGQLEKAARHLKGQMKAVSDPADYAKLEEQLSKVKDQMLHLKGATKQAEAEAQRMTATLNNLQHASIDDLNFTRAKIRSKMNSIDPSSDSYAQSAAKLKLVDAELERIRLSEQKVVTLMQQYDNEIDKANVDIKETKRQMQLVDNTLAHLKTSSVRDLEYSMKVLNQEMRGLDRGSEAFKQMQMQAKQLKTELEAVRAEGQAQQSWIGRTADWFNRMQGVILGAIAAVSGLTFTVKSCVEKFASMDEEMTNVRKYTGQTADEVERMNEDFKKMDTRTAREKLNQLAGDAGRLGITATSLVEEFVDGADKINVALGDDLGDEAVSQIGKLAQMFGEDKTKGLRGAMLATGSAVNELAQNSSASAGYLVDFTARVAGVGKQAGFTQAQIMGLASVLDQNMQQDETAATAVQNLLAKMFQDSAKFAKIAGLNVKEFSKTLKEDANGALLQFLAALRSKGGFAQLAPMFEEMKMDGSRATGVLTVLADKLDDIKVAQDLATKSYAEGTSVINEFNTQNESVRAQLDKAQKKFQDLAIELGQKLYPAARLCISSASLTVHILSSIIDFVAKYRTTLITLTATIIALTVAETAHIVKLKAIAIWQNVVVTGAKKLWAILAAHPYLAVAAAVTTLVAVIVDLSRKTDTAAKAQEALNDIRKEAQEQIVEEQNKLENLRRVAMDETRSLKDRYTAINELNRIVPNYNAQIDKTTGKYKENKQALDDYIKSLVHLYEVQGAKDKLKEIGKERADLEIQRQEQEKIIQKDAEEAKSEVHVSGREGKSMDMGTASLRSKHKADLAKTKEDLAALDKKRDAIKDAYGADIQNQEIKKIKKDDDGGGGGSSTHQETEKERKAREKAEKKAAAEARKREAEAKRKQKQAADSIKAETNQLMADNAKAYAEGKKTYQQYIDDREKITIAGIDKLKALYGEDSNEYRQLLDDRVNAAKKHDEDIIKMREKDIERERLVREANIKAQYNDANSAIYQNDIALDEALYQNEVDAMQRRLSLYNEGSEEWLDLKAEMEQTSLDHQLQMQEAYQNQLKELRQQFGKQDVQAQETMYLNGLENLYKKGLVKEEEYQQMKLEITKQFAAQRAQIEAEDHGAGSTQAKIDSKTSEMVNSAKAAAGDAQSTNGSFGGYFVAQVQNYQNTMEKLKELYGSDEQNHAAYMQAKAQVTGDFLDGMVQKTQVAYNGISNIMSAASAYSQACSDLEQAKISKNYEKQIAAAGNNSKKKKRLEEKRDKELAAAKAKANKKAMKIEIAQAIASTAMAAINAYSSAARVPFIGWTLAPIAAGMATAAGLLQIATIRKQHQAEAAGYYSGGYTGGRRYRREAGVVHEGEFVANHQAVNNSSIRPAFDLIDRAQRANTVGSLTADDISRALGSGGGGAVVTPIVNVSNDNSEVRESLDGVNNAISILNQTLDDGLEIVMPIAGRSGLHRKLKDYERLLDNK